MAWPAGSDSSGEDKDVKDVPFPAPDQEGLHLSGAGWGEVGVDGLLLPFAETPLTPLRAMFVLGWPARGLFRGLASLEFHVPFLWLLISNGAKDKRDNEV